jgi:lipoate-protein ligase A
MGSWPIEYASAPAGELHSGSAGRLFDVARAGRQVRVLEATRPAVVLGSSEPEGHVDAVRAAEAGMDVARRPSGGGAVLVGPGEVLWVDLIIPEGDELWDPDVGRAAWWVGDAWACALLEVGLADLEVRKAPMQSGRWSDRVCFAGVAAGEVLIGGRKAVGLSQRRVRSGALFQTAVLLRWDPSDLLDLMDMDDADRASALADLADVAVGVLPEQRDRLLEAFVRGLP